MKRKNVVIASVIPIVLLLTLVLRHLETVLQLRQTALIIIAVIILIVGAFVSLHFWFHVFFVLPEVAVTSADPPSPIYICREVC